MSSTITNIISVAKVTSVLASNEIATDKIFGRSLRTTERFPLMITTERIIIERIFNADPTYPKLKIASDYVYDLCGKWKSAAQLIVDSSAGDSVVGITPNTLPDRIDFIVSASSFMVTGATSKTITQFIGFNLIFVRGAVQPTTINTEPSYFGWDKVTGEFTCFPQLFVDDVIALIPV